MIITSPFHARSTASEVIAGYDLSGKTALVTGASSGLGLEVARALLSVNAEVILAVRDTMRGKCIAEELIAATSNQKVHILPLDLSSLAAVHQAAEQFYASWSKLDLLIDNAGIMAVPKSYTSDGFEQHFGVNHLGHYVLTLRLLPALQAATPARVVVVSSGRHRCSNIHFDDVNYRHRPYDKWEAYGQSKTANALFALGLTQHFGADGVTANAVNPGKSKTRLFRYLTQEEMRALGYIDDTGQFNSRFKTAEQGAASLVWAAVGKELDGVGGKYLVNCQESDPFDPATSPSGYLPYALDPDLAERLWILSQDLVGLDSCL